MVWMAPETAPSETIPVIVMLVAQRENEGHRKYVIQICNQRVFKKGERNRKTLDVKRGWNAYVYTSVYLI